MDSSHCRRGAHKPEDPTTRRTAAPILLVRTQQGVSDGRPDVVEDALPYLVNKTADGVSAVTITVRASRCEPPDQGGTGTYRGQGNRSPVGAEVAVVAGRHHVRGDHGYLTYVSIRVLSVRRLSSMPRGIRPDRARVREVPQRRSSGAVSNRNSPRPR